MDPLPGRRVRRHPADVRRVRALREAIGPDVRLMVDANEAYNATTAIRIGHKLAELDLMWFEEPVNAGQPGSIVAAVRLCRL